MKLWAGIAQSVQRLSKGRTVQGLSPVGNRDFPHPFRPSLGPTQSPIQWVQVLSKELSGRGVVLITHTYPQPKLKKEQGYISAPPLRLRGLFQGELYLYWTKIVVNPRRTPPGTLEFPQNVNCSKGYSGNPTE